MHVLSEFIRNDITDQQFPIVAPLLFPELFKIFNEEKVINKYIYYNYYNDEINFFFF